MLSYDHERTEAIVARLVQAVAVAGTATMAATMILLGAALSLVGALISAEVWWLFGVIGVAVGYVLGANLAALIVAIIEWMAQLLIAQGEMVEARRGRSRE